MLVPTPVNAREPEAAVTGVGGDNELPAVSGARAFGVVEVVVVDAVVDVVDGVVVVVGVVEVVDAVVVEDGVG